MYSKEELFADNDWWSFADTLFNLTGHSGWTEEEVSQVFDKLPVHVRDIAHINALSDTVFRDEAYRFLDANRNLLLGRGDQRSPEKPVKRVGAPVKFGSWPMSGYLTGRPR